MSSTVPLDLLTACTQAVARRADTGWHQADLARAALGVVRAERRPPPAIPDDWVDRFELDDLDRALLEMAAAAEHDPALNLLLGLLSGDPGPGRPTVSLGLELGGRSPADPAGYARLAPMAPLRKYRLLSVAGACALTSRRLVVPDRVAAQLRGEDLPGPEVLDLIVDAVPMNIRGAQRVANGLYAGEQLVWVYATGGSAGMAMATGACRLLGQPFLAADLRRVPASAPRPSDGDGPHDPAPDPPVIAAAVAGLVDEAALTGSVLVLAGAELAVGCLSLLSHAAMPVIAVSLAPFHPGWTNRLPMSVPAPRLTLGERTALWAQLLRREQVPPAITSLRLLPAQVRQVVGAASEAAALEGLPEPNETHLRDAARRFGRGQHDLQGTVGIGDLVLPEPVRSEVLRLLDWARYRDEVMAQGLLQGKGGKGIGICALFSGGPGTGKTLAAHVVADTLGLDLIKVDLSAVISKYIGESQKNLERVFTEAESLNAVLFFDEADALFGSRSSIKDAHDRYANQEVAYLLQRMESFDGITILASNLRGNIDPAFARRLHFMITFPDPDAVTRARLWTHHLDPVAAVDPADPIDATRLGESVELSGGDIRNVVLAAVYDAVAAREPLGMRHLAIALTRELASLGRRAPAAGWLQEILTRQ